MPSEDTIEFKMNFGQGSGISRSVNSALFRPFRRIFLSGKPAGRIGYIFYHSKEGGSWVLGSLCHLLEFGGRLVFFPGLIIRSPTWYIRQGIKLPFTSKKNETLDHITLEKNFLTWHATLLTPNGFKVSRIPRSSTKEITPGLTFWFVMSIAEPKILEKTPATLYVEFAVPTRDSQRRFELVYNAREGIVDHAVSLHKDHILGQREFLNFEFFLDARNEDERKKFMGLVVPLHPPAVEEKLFIPDDIPTRQHELILPGFPAIIDIEVYKLRGSLSEPCIFSGY